MSENRNEREENGLSENPIEKSRDRDRANLGMEIPVVPQQSPLKILVLQHPQEPDKELGSAALLVRAVQGARLKVGLSWPSLSRAWGGSEVIPSKWAVLYLGGKSVDYPHVVNFVSRKGNPVPAPEGMEGLVVLDGTWSQAKALWWRNPWLLKLRRIVLRPSSPSHYGRLRKEPRHEAVSTMESVALVLGGVGSRELQSYLEDAFQRMLMEYRLRKEKNNHIKEKKS